MEKYISFLFIFLIANTLNANDKNNIKKEKVISEINNIKKEKIKKLNNISIYNIKTKENKSFFYFINKYKNKYLNINLFEEKLNNDKFVINNNNIYFKTSISMDMFYNMMKKIFTKSELININFDKREYKIKVQNLNLINGGINYIYIIKIRKYNNKFNIIKIELKIEHLDYDFFDKDNKRIIEITKYLEQEIYKLNNTKKEKEND